MPKNSFFLLGMRGVGKSSWAKASLPDAHLVNLLDETLFQLYLTKPGAFSEDLSHLKKNSWIIVDEIQRLPNLLNDIHRLMEDKKFKFALLGSSARKLRRQGVNLLGGRALQKFMHPFLPNELNNDFSLNKVLQLGSIPMIWSSNDPKEQLKAYLQLYLKEEIQAEALVRNLPGFARFLPVASLFHAQVINVEGLGRDSGVARSTVEGYLNILEDTLLAFRLPAFSKKLRVKQKTHPKLYWNDSGIVRAAKNQLNPVTIEEKGPLFEGYIAQLLKSYYELGILEYDNISYWSAGKNSVEVDFIIERGKDSIGIEVKSSENLENNDFNGLRTLLDEKIIKRAYIVYLGKRKYTHSSKTEVLPSNDFIELIQNI